MYIGGRFMNDKDITITLSFKDLNINYIDNKLLLDIINGLNDKFIPVKQISQGDEVLFTDTVGFTRKVDQI